MSGGLSIDEYLKKIARFVDDEYGRRFRRQFEDHRGAAELAMLHSPTSEELEQLEKAVAIMTAAEKQNAANLSDETVRRIADDAAVDPALLAIFINGYALEQRAAGKQGV
ncbi:MAG TPA: hypothetical protein P5279_05565 [Anaerohalosphaeraceae bacterium]|jgi:hypothetical protein|nr:hypothetical protein [Anaerohalosphaeraceae bacterium]HRT49939.1 hypothetical protein [Anaerohalosphaeraceae bacterium]HRT85763.1 hypothetical protein [Anaerohalosphaeraceae bacterium]